MSFRIFREHDFRLATLFIIFCCRVPRNIVTRQLNGTMKSLYTVFIVPLVWAEAINYQGSEFVDRDAQSQCAALIEKLGIDNDLPFVPICTCKFSFFSIDWDCTADICPADLVADIGASWNSTNMPFDICLSPSLKGSYKTRNRKLETKTCTGTGDVTFNMSAIAVQAGVPSLASTLDTMNAPEICAVLQHKSNDFSAVDSCQVTIDDENCPCQVCGNDGKQIQLLCPDLLASYLPGVPASMMELTTQCVGVDTFGAGLIVDRVELIASQFGFSL